MQTNTYRPDIDGLRALAVLSVLLFHLNIHLTGGGFTGVDIFFVISGFLITGIIRDEIQRTGTFDYKKFYIRRIRRLVPALLFTIFITAVFSILLLSPKHLVLAGKSIFSSLFSFSNILFWTESGYFDTAADFKPLLHTWSLSIEEQFYFLWPTILLIILTARKNRWGVWLSVTFFGSLLLNFIFQDGQVALITRFAPSLAKYIADGKSTIFYLLPFRIFEFTIGAAVAFLPELSPGKKRLANGMGTVGMGFLLYPILFYTNRTLFPSYNALLPCLGAGLLLYSGKHRTWVSQLLSTLPFTGIGKISYSLYLIHWPIIVFYKYYTFKSLTPYQVTTIIALSLILASFMYFFIEQPFRQGKAKTQVQQGLSRKEWGLVLVPTLLLCILSISLATEKGWNWRIDTPQVARDIMPPQTVEKALHTLKKDSSWVEASQIGDAATEKKVLVLGDSHANQLRAGAKYLSKKYNLSFTFYTFPGCPPVFQTYKVYGAPDAIEEESDQQQQCRNQTAQWEHFIATHRFDFVILSARWAWMFEPTEYYDTEQRRDLLVAKANPEFSVTSSRKVFADYLDYTIKSIQKQGAKVIVFGQVPHAGRDLEGCDDVPHLLISKKDTYKRCHYVPKQLAQQRNAFSDATIKRVAQDNHAMYVLPTEFFCDENSQFCRTFYHGTRLRDDNNHVNDYGSMYLVKKWEQSKDFPFTRQQKKPTHS